MTTHWMPSLDPKLPKYRALYQSIVDAIEAGDLASGDRLPTHRHLADALGVTVGVVTKAYAMAVREGLLQSQVGSGTYVGPPNNGYSPFASDVSSNTRLVDLSISIVPPNPRRVDAVAHSLAAIQQDPMQLRDATLYHYSDGERQARQGMSRLMHLCGMPVQADELMLTLGGQHGLSLAYDVLLRAQGSLAAAEIGYQGVVGLARLRDLKLIPIPMAGGHLDVSAIEGRARQHRIDALYVTPEMHNPTGGTLSQADRERLAELAEQYNFWLIEDLVHSVAASDKPQCLFELAPERTVSVFSTSKLLAGGLRLGAIRVPESHRMQFALAIKSHAWMVPPMLCQIVAHWMTSDEPASLLAWQQSEIQARQKLAAQYLGEWIEVEPDPGCFFVWLTLPKEQTAAEVSYRLLEQGVKVGVGTPFWIGAGPAPEAIRVCLSAADTRDQLENALRQIAQVLQHQRADFEAV